MVDYSIQGYLNRLPTDKLLQILNDETYKTKIAYYDIISKMIRQILKKRQAS